MFSAGKLVNLSESEFHFVVFAWREDAYHGQRLMNNIKIAMENAIKKHWIRWDDLLDCV